MLSKRIFVLVSLLLVSLLLVGCGTTPPNQTPILTSDPITAATVGVKYTYDVNATDPDGDTLTYSFIDRPEGMVINSTTGVINWIPSFGQIGDNPVVVKVSDGSLSIAQSFIIEVSEVPPVNQAPVIMSTPVTTATVGVTYFYDVNATDPDNDVLTYSLTTKPNGMVINSANGLIWWIPTPAQVGNNLVTVMVSDGVLIDIQGFTIVVSKPTSPLETYTITASAGSGGTISPLGDVTVDKGANIVFTITPDTLHNIDVVLADGGSVGAVAFYTFTNVAKDHTIHAIFSAVEPEPEPVVNHKPSITSTPGDTAILGVEYVYDVEATDPDGDTLTYSFLYYDKPTGMTINSATGLIKWIPTIAQVGINWITVKVSDGVLSDTQHFTIEVSEPELIEIKVEPDEMCLIVGGFKTFEVTAYYDNDTNKIVTFKCLYGTSNSSIAYVAHGTDKVTTLTVGTATIFIYYTQYNSLTGEEITKTDEIAVTVSPIPPGELFPEEFGWSDKPHSCGQIIGYYTEFFLTEATFTDAQVVMRLYAGTQLLQTNTLNAGHGLTVVKIGTSFDVFGAFDYVCDGYWTNVREVEYGQTIDATKVIATVTLNNSKVVTAENINPIMP